MIQKIAIRNYRIFREFDLDLSPGINTLAKRVAPTWRGSRIGKRGAHSALRKMREFFKMSCISS